MKVSNELYETIQKESYGIKMLAELQREAYAIRDNKDAKEVFCERFAWNVDFVEGLTGTKITLENWELVVEQD